MTPEERKQALDKLVEQVQAENADPAHREQQAGHRASVRQRRYQRLQREDEDLVLKIVAAQGNRP